MISPDGHKESEMVIQKNYKIKYPTNYMIMTYLYFHVLVVEEKKKLNYN